MKKSILPKPGILKFLLLFFSAMLIGIACSQNSETATLSDTVEPADPMVGVWEQIQSCFLVNGDTVEINDNSVHHKIYLDGYVIWNSDPAQDSSEWHGYGTYRFNNDTLIEELLSMSQSMQDLWGTDMEAILKIEFKENTFKQMSEWVYNDTTYQHIEIHKKLN